MLSSPTFDKWKDEFLYDVYVIIYSDLYASRANLELYCTDASMHLVSHLDRCMHQAEPTKSKHE